MDSPPPPLPHDHQFITHRAAQCLGGKSGGSLYAPSKHWEVEHWKSENVSDSWGPQNFFRRLFHICLTTLLSRVKRHVKCLDFFRLGVVRLYGWVPGSKKVKILRMPLQSRSGIFESKRSVIFLRISEFWWLFQTSYCSEVVMPVLWSRPLLIRIRILLFTFIRIRILVVSKR